ncbi:MAG TPA: ATPase, T2SS/T4P/T4SS family [Oligoflexus sp.]|uniref:type IV pilus twitching motility protein PilT n=1 Tax=Oligoflexus sp. TaxID=1971216 RepID=UPI002D5F8DD0|nr:ATPase, T2SS/T4P/T4SS family [Oligoflexus sp.]HYX37468.1 ATPase, T2SS/T4P/T4SS family [Oligoflexus sp.]
MNSLSDLIQQARRMQASDIHLESGGRVYFRCDGKVKSQGDVISFDKLRQWTMDLLGPRYETLKSERSFDLSEQLGGARCRIHIFYSARGLSYSVRLLAQSQPTLSGLNLHPHFEKILQLQNGLVLISGPTGSGKSTTLAALIHELNVRKSLNIVTLEQPIEYFHSNQNCLIRQREVGRDTPSFDKGLRDAMREDPDVILVGELRDRETIQLTLNAAETGHLVLATLHSSNVSESIQRILSAFPAEIREQSADQLAQVLQAVVCQTLTYIPKFDELVPVCELFFTSIAAKSKIRNGEINAVPDTYYAATEAGCLTREKYRQWVESKPKLIKPPRNAPVPAAPAEPLIQERYEPAVETSKKSSKGSTEGIYTIDDPDDDLWTAIRDLEKK